MTKAKRTAKRTGDFPAWPQFDRKTDAKVLEILHSGRVNYWTGPVGMAFEAAFAKWLGVRNAVSVLNGAMARRVALLALGLDPESGAGAVVVRHAQGEVADLAAARRTAKSRGLPLVEDCTECLGGEWKGRKVGAIGKVSFFSLGADDAFTSGGAGGMVCTDDDALAWEMRSIRDHGYDARAKIDLLKKEGRALYVHRCVGYNLRLTEIQSAIGLGELARFDRWNLPRRRKVGEALVKALARHPLVARAPLDAPGRRNAFPYAAFALDAAKLTCTVAAFAEAMRAKGIPVRTVGADAIAFPTYPVLTAAHVRRMVSAFSACASAFCR